MPTFLRPTADGLDLALLAQPRATRSRVVGEHDGRLEVPLAAPPVDGAANDALLGLFAEPFAHPRRSLSLAPGDTSRRKTVGTAGLTEASALAALAGVGS